MDAKTLPEMHEVKSSHHAAVGYQDGHLYIRFHPHSKTGEVTTWRYPCGPEHLEAIKAGGGRYFHANIRGIAGAEKVP